MKKDRSLFVSILYSRRFPYLVVSTVLCLMIIPPFLHHSYSVDGGYTHWSHWTTCSSTCGAGIRGRVRNCTNPVPSGYGKPCIVIGPHVETTICSSKPCPVDGQWDTWTSWGTCNPNCKDGIQNRNRTCIAPKNGGKECSDKESKFEERKCMNKIIPCPVNGGYSPWESWSACSGSCGRGISERKRICDKPEPKNGGNPCTGAQHEVKECENSPCSSSINLTSSSISSSVSSSLISSSSSSSASL